MAIGQFAIIASLCIATLAPAAAQDADAPKDLRITDLRIGLDGAFKLGCWTQAEVTLLGGDAPYTGLVQITVPDADGVPTNVFTPLDRPVGILPGQPTTARLFMRSGQDGADVRVRFIDETGKKRAERDFHPGPESGGGYIRSGLPPTNRLVVTFGMTQGVNQLIRTDRTEEQQNAPRAVRLDDATGLPLEWYGYESVDAVVLGSSQPELYRPLSQNNQRIEALRRWVELGGRLVIFCGDDAPELLGPGGPLETLIPGRFDTLRPLRESAPIESFAGASSEQRIGNGQIDLVAPRLVDLDGRVLAFSQGPTDLPLVVRGRKGLGEVTFVAVDPDSPPLANWSGRTALLRQALQWPAATSSDETNRKIGYGSGSEDLVNKLRNALDHEFIGVKTAPFGLVALLVVIYILLIGPGDYFFVKWLKRMELTWISFPVIVVAVSAAAYWLAYWMKGDQLRVNQVEIVDVDLGAGQARGTVYTHFFSPRVERYDLGLVPHFSDKPLSEPGRPARLSSPKSDPGVQQLVAWLGAPGFGLGGMEGQGAQTSLFDRGYAFSPKLDTLLGMPVQEWSTKTLVGRWSANVRAPLEAVLEERNDDLVAGHITNRTGMELDECILMHGNWAYSLPPLADGGVATIDDSLQPRSVKTTLTSISGGDSMNSNDNSASRLDAYSTDVARLVRAMMFYDAMGGAAYASSPSRYQSFLDLSALLAGDQAILLARVPNAAGSRWVHDGQPLASDQDRRWVYYRFVIPLKQSE